MSMESDSLVTVSLAKTKVWALILGPLLAILVYYLLPESYVNGAGETVAFSQGGRACAGVVVLMAFFWFTEAIPIAVTAMVPLVFFPLLGIATPGETMKHYASGTVFLFLGGFLLAAGIHRWHLDRRIALVTIRIFGTNPKQMVFGMLMSTAFLSAWVSNSATAAMMCPIAVAMLALVRSTQTEQKIGKDERNFGVCMLLAVAYAASIGGCATIVGSPPNGIFARFLSDAYGLEVSFLQWFSVAIPVTLIMLPIVFFALCYIFFPIKMKVGRIREFH
ncbi:SLC13 family permease [Sutterella sp.]|uniref:SLC13 family permease n=1 Tax=Sutterella sp. TaxID=1981025 RepID=UPI0026DEC8AF|nr:SLC13 family permease [Sutterella sp.]MDO5532911.1 SLC13 family permease [Sutterella sp.]